MRPKITLAVACLLSLVLGSAALAYLAVLVVRECPHCKARFSQEIALSGNTLGAAFYTDGSRNAPMLPDHPRFGKCPVCGGLFWIEETEYVDSSRDTADGKPEVKAPSEKEMLGVLASQTLPRDKEIYLRMRAWWAANDPWRGHPNPKPVFTPEQVKNLRALSSLLDESDQKQRILKAEIARELGNFKECLRLLSHPFKEDQEWTAGFIRSLAQEGVKGVRPFPRSK